MNSEGGDGIGWFEVKINATKFTNMKTATFEQPRFDQRK